MAKGDQDEILRKDFMTTTKNIFRHFFGSQKLDPMT